MKIPPRWVFDIWNEARKSHSAMRLRTLPSDCAELDRLEKHVAGLFSDSEFKPAVIIGLAWALYVFDDDDSKILNDDTKFAFTSFLKTGGAQLVQAYDILAGTVKLSPRSSEFHAYEAAKKADFTRNSA